MDKIFFDSWESVIRTFLITIMAYVGMVVLLRAYGKRSLSKMNAFDFIVTVALGSSLATVALNKNVALVDGLLAFFLLLFLQYIITWLSVRVKMVKKLVTSQPSLLLYKGELFEQAMKKERITIEEIHSVARENGFQNLESIDAIILETTGDIVIIPRIDSAETTSTLEDVQVPDDETLE